jgi:phenylacetate-coenzyme A ligase PaaK-like adenylate-forming protein
VRAVREDNRDEMVVSVVSERRTADFDAVRSAVEARIKDRLGVRMRVDVVAPGELDAWTGVGTSPKLKRFRDDRPR